MAFAVDAAVGSGLRCRSVDIGLVKRMLAVCHCLRRRWIVCGFEKSWFSFEVIVQSRVSRGGVVWPAEFADVIVCDKFVLMTAVLIC